MTSATMLKDSIKELLVQQSQLYKLNIDSQYSHIGFKQLIQQLYHKFNQRVVVLVDEYDKPILDNIDDPDTAGTIRDELKSFYSVIKENDAYIKFAFLTGVSKFSKVSLFSGLNNLKDITLDSRYATLCGYTEQDIKTCFAEYILEVDFNELKLWYNGYNFSGEPLFNPYDILLYLDQREFRSYWFETGSPEFLIKLLQQRQYYIPQLEQLQASETLLFSFDIENLQIEALLFQTGYLTIKNSETLGARKVYRLDYPNLEVKISLSDVILNTFTQNAASKERHLNQMYSFMLDGKVEQIKTVLQSFLASIPHDWYRKNQLSHYEGYYASIIYCYFAALGFDITAEDTTNQGRIDLSIRLQSIIYLIAFKVIENIQQKGKALQQLKSKQYAEKYQNSGQTIYLVGLELDKQQRNIVFFEWEQV